jgi:hypothetical protein
MQDTIRTTLGLPPVDPDVERRFGPPTYTAEQVQAYASARAEALEAALRRVLHTLTIPAAEYVPAIPDAWAIIEDALKGGQP